jgi:hypothetical protein
MPDQTVYSVERADWLATVPGTGTLYATRALAEAAVRQEQSGLQLRIVPVVVRQSGPEGAVAATAMAGLAQTLSEAGAAAQGYVLVPADRLAYLEAVEQAAHSWAVANDDAYGDTEAQAAGLGSAVRTEALARTAFVAEMNLHAALAARPPAAETEPTDG